MVEEVATQVAVQAQDDGIPRCGKCNSCEIEKIGCGCDGAYDDGCFLCRPERHERPLCPMEPFVDLIESRIRELETENAELLAALPRCHYGCPNIGTKWVSRTCLYCDTHGAIYLQDAPWAEYARRKGLAGKHGNVPDPS